MYILSSRIKIKIMEDFWIQLNYSEFKSVCFRFKHQFHNKFKMTPSEMANDPAHQKC